MKGPYCDSAKCARILAVFIAATVFADPGPVRAQVIDELEGPPPAASGAQAGEPRRQVPVNETQDVWDDPLTLKPAPGQVNPGIVRWNYSPNRVLPLVTRAFMWTTVVFPEDEVIQDWYVGEEFSFEVRRPKLRENVLLIRPDQVVGADTSITAIGRLREETGRRNVYTMYVRSVGHDYAEPTDMTVFVEDRPYSGVFSAVPGREPGPRGAPKPAASAAATAEEKATPDYLRKIPFDPDTLSFEDYKVFAKDDESLEIAPVRVFHDGHFTFLDFGENGRADRILRPVVFRVVDEVDNPVNTRTTGPIGNIMVVEGVGHNLTLRNGARVVCIVWNGSLDPVPAPDAPQIAPRGGSQPEPSGATTPAPATAANDGVTAGPFAALGEPG